MTRHLAHSLERVVGGSGDREGRYHFVGYRLGHCRGIVPRRSFTRGTRRCTKAMSSEVFLVLPDARVKSHRTAHVINCRLAIARYCGIVPQVHMKFLTPAAIRCEQFLGPSHTLRDGCERPYRMAEQPLGDFRGEIDRILKQCWQPDRD